MFKSQAIINDRLSKVIWEGGFEVSIGAYLYWI